MTYIARSTVLVESGEPRVDVTVYHDDGLSSLRDVNTPLWRGRALARSGYTYDFVDPVDLASPAAGAVPGRLFGNYRALVIDGEAAMAPDAAVAVLRSALRGLPVVIVGAAPSRSSGLSATRVRIAMAALTHLRNVARRREDDVPRLGAPASTGRRVRRRRPADRAPPHVVRRRLVALQPDRRADLDARQLRRERAAVPARPVERTTTPVAEFDARRADERAGRRAGAGSIGIAFRGRAGVHATSSTAARSSTAITAR
jgi:hypothetical protein